MRKIIVIDAGHGGFDPGASHLGLHEEDINLALALRTQALLVPYADELTVIMTRTLDASPLGSTDKNSQLLARAKIANDADADFFLSIHVNANGGEGFESFVQEGMTGKETLNFQEIVHSSLAAYYVALGCVDRGMKQADLSVLRNTKMPAVLIENLFIDNPHDAAILTNGTHLDGIAEAIAYSLLSVCGIKKHVVDVKPIPGSTNTPEVDAAIAFVKEKGIMLGYGGGSFGEHDTITRGQIAVIIHRLMTMDETPQTPPAAPAEVVSP